MNRDDDILKPFLIKELSQLGLYDEDWLKNTSCETLYDLAKQYDHIITNWLNSEEYIVVMMKKKYANVIIRIVNATNIVINMMKKNLCL